MAHDVYPRVITLMLLFTLAACQPEDMANFGDDQRENMETNGVSESGSGSGSGSNSESQSDCNAEDYQCAMLEQLNAARASARTCGETEFAAAPALSYQSDLSTAAEQHSRDMATNNFFSHTGSDGLKLKDRVNATGYPWRSIGENIAAGQDTVEKVMEGWLGSEGHCRNIMNEQFEQVGVSRVDNEAADYPRYWTQVFATPR